MPFFVAVSGAADPEELPQKPDRERIVFSHERHHLVVEWSWPVRCYRVRHPPPSFRNYGDVWLILDGYPELANEAGARSRLQASGMEAISSAPALEIETCPDDPADEMTCFTSVLIAPNEGILEAQRDWLGGRTAYWCQDRHAFCISTSSARLAGRCTSTKEENPGYLADFFSKRAAPPGLSAFSGVNQILPSESLRYEGGRLIRGQCVKDRPFINIDWNNPAHQFKEAFFSAVKATLPRETRPALMLSGGMDSGPVAGVSARIAESIATQPLVVSWQLKEFPDADESGWIRMIADFLDLDCDLYEASHLLPFSRLEPELVSEDFPMFNPFRPLIREAYRRARSGGSNVILNASGGDMLYPHPNWRLYDGIRRYEFAGVAKTLADAFRGKSPRARSGRVQIRHVAGRLLRGSHLAKRKPPVWLSSQGAAYFSRQRDVTHEARRYRDPLYADQLLSSAHGTALENSFSNRYGLDRRDPFQNPGLVSLMLQMPFSLSYRDGMDKWLMREAMKGLLPEQIRLKGRTGLLNSFYSAGFERNKALIREFLLTGGKGWQRWVRREYVETALAKDRTPETDQLLIASCIGHSLWKQALGEYQA